MDGLVRCRLQLGVNLCRVGSDGPLYTRQMTPSLPTQHAGRLANSSADHHVLTVHWPRFSAPMGSSQAFLCREKNAFNASNRCFQATALNGKGHGEDTTRAALLVGGFLPPILKICSSIGISPSQGENSKNKKNTTQLKTPTASLNFKNLQPEARGSLILKK